MTRVAGLLFFLTAASAALFLFHIKHEVRVMDQELGIAHRDNLRHQEAIRVLETEWSYLNQPARIADLAGRHLDLRSLTARQFVRLGDLPPRRARPAPALAPTLAKAPAPHRVPRQDTASTEAGNAR